MFEVINEKCNQCLFTKDRIVSEKRMREVLADCARSDTHFVCHKSSIAGGGNACCRGFYDRAIATGKAPQFMRIAQRLDMVKFIEVPGAKRAASSEPEDESDCPECGGAEEVECPDCGGDGTDEYGVEECEGCGAMGVVPCFECQ